MIDVKAFTLYSKEQINLYALLDKLKIYGECNCDFQTFTKIYEEWHLKTFPGCPVSTTSSTFRGDWLISFVNFIANYEIDGRK